MGPARRFEAAGTLAGRGRLLVTFVVALLAATAVLASGASAAPASRSGGSAAASLCGAARGVAASLRATAKLSPTKPASPAQLKRVYTAVTKAEPSLLGAAHGKQKADLRVVFAFVNLVDSALKKANWTVSGLIAQPTVFNKLVAAGTRAAKPWNRLERYFRGTCRIKNV
jgi:hypothetical protein